MKKIATLLLALVLLALPLAGCGVVNSLMGKVDDNAQGDTSTGSGYHDARLGETLGTVFFEYTVESAQLVDSYEGYTPAEGIQLLDVVLRVKNTFGEELPMFNSDFQIQWGEGDEDYGYGLTDLGDTVMPEEYTLKRGESVTYHVVYEVPEGSSDFSVSYLELFSDGSEGDVYFIYFEL